MAKRARDEKTEKPGPVGKPQKLHCPRCITPTMLEQTFAGVQVQICMRCGANFLHGPDVVMPPKPNRKTSAVLCPVPGCKGQMERLSFAGDPPLEIERCPTCGGILLDFEEIRRITLVDSSAGGAGAGGR